MDLSSTISEIIDAIFNTIKKEFTTFWGIINLSLVCIGIIILIDFRNYGFETSMTILIIGLLPCTAIVNRIEKRS